MRELLLRWAVALNHIHYGWLRVTEAARICGDEQLLPDMRDKFCRNPPKTHSEPIGRTLKSDRHPVQ